MLELHEINTYYGEFHALKDISFRVEHGEFFLIIGPNGHGKSTLLKTISGLLRPQSGNILFEGVDITTLTTDKIVQRGLVYVPEARHLFPDMTVLQNLLLGAYNKKAKARRRENLEHVFRLFPALRDFSHRKASTLSGGEARMLTIGRGIMSDARLLAIDEPSLGLAPKVRNEVFEKIYEIKELGVTVLLVEQNVTQVVNFADRVCLIEHGNLMFQGTTDEALLNDHVRDVYLGG